MKITVLEILPVRDQGCLRAFVNIQIGPIQILKCRWVQQDGQQGFCQPPQEVSPAVGGGRPRFYPLIKWPPIWQEQITQAVAAEMRDHPHGIRASAPAAPIGREIQRKAGVGGRS